MSKTMRRGNIPASPIEDYRDIGGAVSGMTIRESFAMAAMSGIVCDRKWIDYAANETGYTAAEVISKASVECADALLAELERTGGGHE